MNGDLVKIALAKTIFDQLSDYERIRIVDDDDIRVMMFDNYGAQSIQSLNDPDQIQMQYIKTMIDQTPQNIESALVLGIGGGILVRWLFYNIPNITIHAVELDPMVVQIARKYFDMPKHPRIKIFIGDAEKFVKRPAKYDVAYIDTYSGQSIPDNLQTKEFFQNVKNISNIAMINLFNIGPDEIVGINFKEAFTNYKVIKVLGGGNIIIVGDNK